MKTTNLSVNDNAWAARLHKIANLWYEVRQIPRPLLVSTELEVAWYKAQATVVVHALSGSNNPILSRPHGTARLCALSLREKLAHS